MKIRMILTRAGLAVMAMLVLRIAQLAAAVEACVRILQTTDIHGRIFPDPDTGASWLRIATIIEQQRVVAGKDGIMLIDCGDAVQGSFEASHSRGRIAAELLREIDYDVWVPGNHELDFGTERFLELAEVVGHERILNGNFRIIKKTAGIREPVKLAAWRLFERGNARIAVIGANVSYLENWHWGQGVSDYEVEPAMNMLDKVLGEIHAAGGVDLIILALHQGWLPEDERGINEVVQIARRYPDIDLILGGHTHRSIPGLMIGNRAWYVQAGRHAEEIAIIDAIVDTEADETINIQSVILPVGSSVAISANALAAIKPLLDNAAVAAAEKVGETAAQIATDGRPGVDCAMSELLCRAMATATGADFVIHGILSSANFEPGPVTRLDVFRAVPYENQIALASLTPAELAVIVEEQYLKRDSYVACGIYGFHADVTPAGNVSNLRLDDGQPLNPEKRYKVAFNSYTVAGGGGRFPRLRAILRDQATVLTDAGMDTRQALHDYLSARQNLKIEPISWLHELSQSGNW